MPGKRAAAGDPKFIAPRVSDVSEAAVGGRTRRGAERARQILEISEKLFHEHGYAQTSMDDIAKATGLLKGSLYYYMDSKEDLLFQIVQDVHEISQSQLDAARARIDLAPLDRLLAFVEAQAEYLARNVTHVAVYHHEWYRLEGDRLALVRKRRHEYDDQLRALLEEAMATPDVDDRPDKLLVANSILALICWPYTWYRPSIASPRDFARFCAEFVRGALAPRPDADWPPAKAALKP